MTGGNRLAPQWKQRALRRGLLLFSVILLVFLIGEGSLRLYFALVPAPHDSPYIKDPDSLYRLRPGPFWEDGRAPEDIVNSFGFRDREPSIPKPPGTFRIVGIGDSFVLGAVPIEDNFLRVTERALNASSGGDSLAFEVSMMGLGGYGPENELGILRSTALSLDPNLVILCFYIGNDVTGIPLKGEVLGGELYFVRSSNRWHNLLRKSRLFIVAEKVVVTRWRLRNLRAQRSHDSKKQSERSKPTLYYLLIQKKRLPIYSLKQVDDIEPLWRRAEEVLREFDRVCRAASVPWLLLLIPTEEQIDPLVRREVLDALSLDEDNYDFDLPLRRLDRFATPRGIDLLDLTPAFRKAHRSEGRLYIPNDTHWNRLGNRLAGEAIDAYVRARYGMGDSPEPADRSERE